MIGWAIASLLLGAMQPGAENVAQNARCAPVFTLMGEETGRNEPSLRPVPGAGTRPDAARPRRDERARPRPCLHLAAG